ncbi:hypothetical protein QT231_17675 [Halomonas sp. SpR1]|uniref:hypothetical protein n=1 Tax=Halomonas sp. SpR1 TaxID=3050462 RepID=UPI0027E4E848|nr:hypothetical protein [Halomonas sp. SpR1]MDQ7734542.1 hypothetical protein [Halomonas sp. SpR1]
MLKGRLKQLGRIFSVISAAGFSIVLLLNVVAIFMFGKPEAIYFSPGWWFQWFPAYIAWFPFLMLAIVFRTHDNSRVD